MFLKTLPPELRIKIYATLIGRTIVTRIESPHVYHGLILSCKQVHAEYTFEADKSIKPINAVIESRWKFQELKLDPGGYCVPMQIHVSIPLQVLKLTERERKARIASIITPLLANRTRVVFSLYDSDFQTKLDYSNKSTPDIEWDWFGLALLYNILCCVIPKYRGENCERMLYRPAANRWADKGYKLVSESNVPVWRFKYVALHAQNRIVVYDSHMSQAELEGASSGHLWINTAPPRHV